MKKLDPRSVMIGFLLAVIGFMSIGATDQTPSDGGGGGLSLSDFPEDATFNRITVNEIRLNDMGLLDITDKDGKRVLVIERGYFKDNTRLELYNKHERGVVYLSTTKEEDGHIVLSDRYGEGQWGVTGKRK